MAHIVIKLRNLFLIFVLLNLKVLAQTQPEFRYTNPRTNKNVGLSNFLGSFKRLPLSDCLSAYGMLRFKVSEKNSIDAIEVMGNLPDTLVKTIRKKIMETQNHWRFPQNKDGIDLKKWFTISVFVERQSSNNCPENKVLMDAYRWMNQLFRNENQILVLPTSYLLPPMSIFSVK